MFSPHYILSVCNYIIILLAGLSRFTILFLPAKAAATTMDILSDNQAGYPFKIDSLLRGIDHSLIMSNSVRLPPVEVRITFRVLSYTVCQKITIRNDWTLKKV